MTRSRGSVTFAGRLGREAGARPQRCFLSPRRGRLDIIATSRSSKNLAHSSVDSPAGPRDQHCLSGVEAGPSRRRACPPRASGGTSGPGGRDGCDSTAMNLRAREEFSLLYPSLISYEEGKGEPSQPSRGARLPATPSAWAVTASSGVPSSPTRMGCCIVRPRCTPS